MASLGGLFVRYRCWSVAATPRARARASYEIRHLRSLHSAAAFFADPKHKLYDYYAPASAKYYEQLMDSHKNTRLGSSPFLRTHVAASRPVEKTQNEHFPHLPINGWELKVRFKR